MRRTRAGAVCLVVVLALGVGACGGGAPPAPAPTTSASTTPTTTPTPTPTTAPTPTPTETPAPTPTASAADDLAAFVEAARAADTRLRAAAALINGSVRSTAVVVDARTVEAVDASHPWAVVATIPAGMPPELLRAVLTTYSDLVSRHRAMSRVAQVGVGTFPRGEYNADDILTCLPNGSPAAARFAADLAAVERLAGSTPPLPGTDPASQEAAEVAVRVAAIGLFNGGCDTCGGYVATEPAPLTWDDAASGATTRTGTVSEITFTATYAADDGWAVHLQAC